MARIMVGVRAPSFRPMLAVPGGVDDLPGADWLVEVKLDGWLN